VKSKSLLRRRLVLLVGAIVLLELGISYLTLRLQWQWNQLNGHLDKVDRESLHIAENFADFLRQLNDQLYQYGRSHVPANRAAFNRTSLELDQWLEGQKKQLITAEEKECLQQIDAGYHDYLQSADQLLGRLQELGEVSATVDDYTDVQKRSGRLFEQTKNLSRAHLDSRTQTLASMASLTSALRMHVLLALGLLSILALALGAVVYRDMIVPLRTKLVESESLRERQEKLASLGVLAAGVAHEVRNPLTAIKGILFLQEKELPPGSKAIADVKLIEHEILRLERIVNDFLLFARPSELRLERTTANAILREAQELLAPELGRHAIRLVLAETPPLPVEADHAQLKQVVINLVRNAAESIDTAGEVRLSARLAHRRLNHQEARVVLLEVADNGKGMGNEVQKRLFDPFFTTKETGTGLGLSIALRIVQSHGGLLEYQTAPGVGTTFGIALPLAEGPDRGGVP
jgi:signal transduction histidine kinase